MARLFIKHQPVECEVSVGHRQGSFNIKKQILVDANLTLLPNTLDVAYVCVVHEASVWAARNFMIHNSSTMVQLTCVKMEDQPCVQEMLLADMILN